MNFKFILCLLVLTNISALAQAQTAVSIPGYTAYAVPAENPDDETTGGMFVKPAGIQNWTNPDQQIQFFCKIRHTGALQIALFTKNELAGNRITLSIAGKKFNIDIPRSNEFKLIQVGSVMIRDTGFFQFTLSASDKKGKAIADIRSLELSGEAANNIHFNPGPRRNAASVHLMYQVPDTAHAVSFYNEIRIPKNSDILHSYFMACGFARGYFGIQVNSPTERRVIFSVWDAGNEAIDRNKVSLDNKVQLLAKGENVFADGFGNEGTGGHSHWLYNWKTDSTYRFLVTAAVDSASNSTHYAGYFFVPETKQWKLIACFRAPKDGKPLRRLYSFVENFEGNNGQLFREAYFTNPWIRRESGEWKEITESKFSYDATGKAGERLDYGGGATDNGFYLWNGGFKSSTTAYGDLYTRKSGSVKPIIDLYKNADSASEAEIEKIQIRDAVQAGKLDTTGSMGGAYYKLETAGTGDPISINDTLVCFYKGSLLNGFVFDKTKDEPAHFPIKRLIKGMQALMPVLRKGTKIRMILPSGLAYSIRNFSEIPPNSLLLFDMEVLEINQMRTN